MNHDLRPVGIMTQQLLHISSVVIINREKSWSCHYENLPIHRFLNLQKEKKKRKKRMKISLEKMIFYFQHVCSKH